jgi:hypothetical protein
MMAALAERRDEVVGLADAFFEALSDNPPLEEGLSLRLLEEIGAAFNAVPVRFSPLLFSAVDSVRLKGPGLEAVAPRMLAYFDQAARLAAAFPAVHRAAVLASPAADGKQLGDILDRDHPGEFYSWHVVQFLTMTVENIARGSGDFRRQVRALEGPQALAALIDTDELDDIPNGRAVRKRMTLLVRVLSRD